MSRSLDIIIHYVMGLRIIDTHEHLPVFEKLCEQNTDILREYLLHSFISDLRSAGMSDKSAEQARDISIPLLKRWDMVEPFWEQVRYTGYGQVLDLAARDIYGFPRIDRDTIEPLNSAFMTAFTVFSSSFTLNRDNIGIAPPPF